MSTNKRKHRRFSATAFLNMPVTLSPLVPFFGEVVQGRLIDLSAGGMALIMKDLIPQGTRLNLVITFPDQTKLETLVQVKYVNPRDRQYLHGFEFMSIPSYMATKIEKMSSDYIDCENRINKEEKDVCRANCAFFTMCSKPERKDPVFNVDVALEFAFKMLEDSPLRT